MKLIKSKNANVNYLAKVVRIENFKPHTDPEVTRLKCCVIDGFNIMEFPEEAKKRIGYLPEIPPLYIDMKVREYLNFIYDLKGVKFPKRPHIDEVLKLV